jgi:high-affinity K+ transport system ATPase subunit B
MAINWKNPIIFGVVVGLVLCLFLFLHDKLFRKKEDKNGFSVYLKLFMAGFLASGSMAWLFFNRDLSFSTSSAKVIDHKGGSVELDEVSTSITPDAKNVAATVVERVKGVKRCHADEPNWD